MHAIVVVGRASEKDNDKLRFEKMAADVINKLNNKFGIKKYNIRKLNLDFSKDIKTVLEKIFIEKREQDILLIYIGHGQENGWALNGRQDENALYYDELGMILTLHERKLIFLNCCCYAGAATFFLPHQPKECLLIVAMPEDCYGYAHNFFCDIFDAWSKNRLYNPRLSNDNPDFTPQVEGNEELQRLFFPDNLKIWGIIKKMIKKLFNQ